MGDGISVGMLRMYVSIMRFVWRKLRPLLRVLGLLRPQRKSIAALAAECGWTASVEIVHGAANAPLLAAAYQRPLAVQLAVTAHGNVRKGRRPARCGDRRTAVQTARKASAIKAKPVTKVATKKRAPKRRHVWLSTQTRVVRPVAGNVVHLHAAGRTQRPGCGRSGGQKSNVRPLRIAA